MPSLVAVSAPRLRYTLLAVCALVAVVGMHAFGVHTTGLRVTGVPVVADLSHGPVHAMASSMVAEATVAAPADLSPPLSDPISGHDGAHELALCTFLVLATFISIGRRRSVPNVPGAAPAGLLRRVVRPEPPVPRFGSVFASA